MDSLARFLVHRSRLVLGLTAIVTLTAVAMLPRMSFDADVASFLLQGNPTGEEFAGLQEKYGSQDPINVVASLPEGETFATAANLALVAELRDELAAVQGVETVAAIVPDTSPVTGASVDAAAIRAFPDQAVASFLSQNPMAEILVSEDGRHTLVMVSSSGDLTATARRVLEVTHPGLELTFSGNPVVFASVIDALSLILLVIPPAVIVLLVGVFYATIGDRRLSLLAIVPAVLGSLWTFGLVFGLGFEIDIVTVIVPIFVIVMGSADGLHFVTHFQKESARTADPTERVSSALSHVGVPMILTTISTAAGFASLVATNVEPLRQLGLFTAVGICFAGIVSFFSLPALISHLHLRPGHQALIGAPVTRLIRRAVRTRLPAGVLLVGIIAFSVVALPRLEVNADQLFFFKADDPVRIAFERTEELFGGATPLMGEFAFDPADPEGSLVEARAVSEELEARPGVRKVFSVVDLADRLPSAEFEAVLAGETSLPLGKMATDDGLRFILLPADFTTSDLEGWLSYVEDREEIRALTGMPVVWREISDLVLDAQMSSLAVAYLLVTLLLAITYRRLRDTVVSLVPITLTILMLLGFIAVSDINLNLVTAVASSIVIGVGIDYVIHYLAAISHARSDGDGYVLRAIDRAGPPIVANALGVAVALSALWMSPLLVHAQLSQIMWVAMLGAAVTSLVVVPALLPRTGVVDRESIAAER
jgi:uncharacterized protein